ncbi:MAG: XRE family transcriptional regulator [Ignavibacteriaceae bacterium]|nr:XRE family transcriptional regulator [Ignavibacteriaceae bacterium]
MGNSINPNIISWARQRAGYDYKNLPKNVDTEKLKKWESGTSAPTFTQLEALAKIFNIPVAVFFFPEPPKIKEPIKKFRVMPNEVLLKFSPDTYKRFHLAQSYQDSLYELAKDFAPEKKIFHDINPANLTAVELADSVRNYLKVDIEKQFKLPNAETAFKFWRRKVEDAGVFTFKDSFKDRFISGFCLLDEVYPIIFINNSTEFTRQIFTLIHELGHILCDINGLTVVDDDYINRMNASDRKLEIYCNQFAGNLLVPPNEFRKDINYFHEWGPESIEKVAKKYSVSKEVILRRLLDNGIIGQRYYEIKANEWKAEYMGRVTPPKGGNYYLKRLSYLGQGFTNIVNENLKRGKINDVEAAEHLHVRAKYLKPLFDHAER